MFFYCTKKGEGALLNVRQEAFCLHYAESGNATESYKKAGYKPRNDNTAAVSATELLRNPKIQARLAELAKEMESNKIANIKEIQERLTAILRQQQSEEQIVVTGTGEGISIASKMEKKPQLRDVLKAAELLAKMQGGFDNSLKVEMTVPVFGGEGDLKD